MLCGCGRNKNAHSEKRFGGKLELGSASCTGYTCPRTKIQNIVVGKLLRMQLQQDVCQMEMQGRISPRTDATKYK